MRFTTRAAACCLVFPSAAAPAFAQDKPTPAMKAEQNQHEERAIARTLDRAAKAADTDRHRWLRELGKAYQKTVAEGMAEADYGGWFDLLADGGTEWRRDKAPKPIAELYDRVAQKLELGPVPTIKRDEFLLYARKHLLPANTQPPKPPDVTAEADKVFRVLDQDGNGILEADEWTDRLRAALRGADTDGNGRIDKDEYRVYFEGRLAAGPAPATKPPGSTPAKPGETPPVAKGVKLPPGLPAWFAELDTDHDGQVGLYEWRAAGLPSAQFARFDLDGDGLLPAEEYLRCEKVLPPESLTVDYQPKSTAKGTKSGGEKK